ncbi:MAG: P27 family phage terminase small subunit [Spirosoma sp.]|nr:P27 family phage terminase small subunit [Spirosoma sp.]
MFDLPQPRLWVEEHQVMAHQCASGCVQTGQFPAGVDAPVQYGPRIQAQSVLLNVDYRVPFAKVKQFWTDLTGYAYNPATLISTQPTLQAQLMPVEATARQFIFEHGSIYESPTKDGGRIVRAYPQVNIASDAFKRVRAMLIEFGATPAVRSKVNALPCQHLSKLDLIKQRRERF